MFRAVALSIALIVGVGPGAALLCRAWCDPLLAAASGCHHPGAGDESRVASTDACDDLAITASPFLQEDARRSEAPPPSDHGLVTARHDFIPRSFQLLPPARAESGHPLQGPPLSLNLRI